MRGLQKTNTITLSSLQALTGCVIPESVKLDLEISDIAAIEDATEADVTFLANASYSNFARTTNAGFCLITSENAHLLPQKTTPLIVSDPYVAIITIVRHYYRNLEFRTNPSSGISKSATVGENVKLGQNITIGENVILRGDTIVGDNVIIMPNTLISDSKIGDNCIIHDNCTIMFSTLGQGCVIKSGSRIGTAGFGFAPNFKTGEHITIPQIARVLIGANVNIGANTTIDRGFLKDTIIEDNVKIDNLAHIAHGVRINQGCIIAGQVGIAGSTTLDKMSFCGGQVGISGHLYIAPFTKIISGSGVIQNIKTPATTVAGYPSMPIFLWHKLNIILKKLASNKTKS